MKKIVYLSVLLFGMYVSGQKTYQQYKQEREYSQRYANEQRQKFINDVNKALNQYSSLTDQYLTLVKKHKSTTYVEKNYPKICKPMYDVQLRLLSAGKSMTWNQSDKYNEIHHKWLVIQDSYGY
ncbi:hypothetical protein SAMN05421786_104239 [Chryseobacterium ureilyticum]|uniref:Uncharacterized protein n=1 Tax=Chryseobacterium ureilyticum TaxID=373668 RepID=A0A1N7P066_9FLAO|nr:hypothetical protein [Chryseobacterium ureilyticum]SIT03973.1 hypothetical protein SAMN05421786_104239 [Chryseobacterium ureilyticum]